MEAKQRTVSPLVILLDRIAPFLIVLIFGLIFGFFFIRVIQPEYQKYLPGGPLHADTEKVRLLDRTRYRDDLKKLFDLYKENTSGELDGLSLLVPDTQDVPTLLAGAEKLIRTQGASLQSIEFVGVDSDAKPNKPGIFQFEISLQLAQVDYPRFKNILSALESQIRLTDITAVDYDPSAKTASITAKVYWSPTKKTIKN